MRKPARRFKDSGPIAFEVTLRYVFPRRDIKRIFDHEKNAILKDPDNTGDKAFLTKVRRLKFADFLKELDSNFVYAYHMGEVDPEKEDDFVDWVAEQFDEWVKP